MWRNLWRNTYARTDAKEYWAEGLESYFNVNREGPANGDGAHDNINTRTELKHYDRPLYSIGCIAVAVCRDVG